MSREEESSAMEHCQTASKQRGPEAPQAPFLHDWLGVLPLSNWTWGKRGKLLQCGLTLLLLAFAGAFVVCICICLQFNQCLWIYCQGCLLQTTSVSVALWGVGFFQINKPEALKHP